MELKCCYPRRIAALMSVSEPAVPPLVLLVDDERTVRRTVKLLLESLGYEVELAEDGEQGVESFCKQQGRLSLVLLDMVMPKLDGAGAFRRMRAIDPTVPVVVCSGYPPGEEVKGLLSEGLAGYLSKPYRREQLRVTLESVLAQRGSDRQAGQLASG